MDQESLVELEQELLRHKKKRKTARKRTKGELEEAEDLRTLDMPKERKQLRTRPRYRPRGG